MTAMARGSRTRVAIAAVALIALGAGVAVVIGVLPRAESSPPVEAGATSGDPHAGHSVPVTGEKSSSPAAAVEPPAADSIGSTPETSLDAAAGAEIVATGGGDSNTGGITLEALPAAPSAPREGANGLGTPRTPVAPAEVKETGVALGGCRPEYGATGQCLPVIPPSQAEHAAEMRAAGEDPSSMVYRWTCSDVRSLFPDGIAVRVPGVDPDGLDDDGDGRACEPG